MTIAVLGTGNVGRALALGWAAAGHRVVFGTREPVSAETEALVREVAHGATARSIPDAVAAGEVVALALPWNVSKALLPSLAPALQGKVLVDCTNPVARWPEMDHANGSGGEQVAVLAPGARVVKAFNSTGFDNMLDPRYPDGALTMLYAGDDAAAMQVVARLATDLGFEAVAAGPLSNARALEVMAGLWGVLAHGQGLGRQIGFRLLRRDPPSGA